MKIPVIIRQGKCHINADVLRLVEKCLFILGDKLSTASHVSDFNPPGDRILSSGGVRAEVALFQYLCGVRNKHNIN